MIDLKLLNKEFGTVVSKLEKKYVAVETVEELKKRYLKYKTEKSNLEKLQALQNEKSKLFQVYLKEKRDISELKKEVAENKKEIAKLSNLVKELEQDLEDILMQIPNIPADEVPEGEDENSNVELEKILEPKNISNPTRDSVLISSFFKIFG